MKVNLSKYLLCILKNLLISYFSNLLYSCYAESTSLFNFCILVSTFILSNYFLLKFHTLILYKLYNKYDASCTNYHKVPMLYHSLHRLNSIYA